jgi:hypothetical protein
MTPPRIEDFARLFPQNGLKLLLCRGLNVRDLLQIGRSRYVKDIDFAQLKPDVTSYAQRDYRHVESDIVLRGLLKGRGRQDTGRGKGPGPDRQGAEAATHQAAAGGPCG